MSGPRTPDTLPVTRSKDQARRFYDRLSRVYGWLAGPFERKHARRALELLAIEEGEMVLEIGFGVGDCLDRIARSSGGTGRAFGVDISAGMLAAARRRLGRSGVEARVGLCLGDAARLPYRSASFDAVFMSFTVELFDTPEIPAVLDEVSRVLKPGGRLGVAGMSKEGRQSWLLRLYEWAHMRWPTYLDCRPIYVERSIKEAGYSVRRKETVSLFGIPCEIVVAVSGA